MMVKGVPASASDRYIGCVVWRLAALSGGIFYCGATLDDAARTFYL